MKLSKNERNHVLTATNSGQKLWKTGSLNAVKSEPEQNTTKGHCSTSLPVNLCTCSPWRLLVKKYWYADKWGIFWMHHHFSLSSTASVYCKSAVSKMSAQQTVRSQFIFQKSQWWKFGLEPLNPHPLPNHHNHQKMIFNQKAVFPMAITSNILNKS